MKNKVRNLLHIAFLMSIACAQSSPAGTFGEDAAFLKKHTSLIVLSDSSRDARVALAPAWQGRVMTSTASGDSGQSFGWINRELIASGKTEPHINVFGGEDRFWIGPEGGQFSIFFAEGAEFQLSDWYTPPPLDTLPFIVVKESKSSATFRSNFELTNYSGTRFHVGVDRKVSLVAARKVTNELGLKSAAGLKLVAYESVNTLFNNGKQPWEKPSGLLSIWILGMFNASPNTTIVVPIKPGPDAELGTKVTSDYFGSIPPERLVVKEEVIYFSGDARYRSKIGVSPKRSKGVLGSYDAVNRVLTIVQFSQPEGVTDYVNSLWKVQDNPYGGDAVNSYNDGPAAPGAKQLGQFYELESSSPAAALAPGKSMTHRHRTVHLEGPDEALDHVARTVLGVSLEAIRTALRK